MTGMRLWIGRTSAFARVVTMQKVRSQAPEAGSCQFSHSPARPNGAPSFIAMAKGCRIFEPFTAFHSKKPSIGMMQRRLA